MQLTLEQALQKQYMMQKNNYINLVIDKKDKVQKVLLFVSRLFVILMICSFALLFVDKLTEFFGFFFILFLGILIVIALINYIRKPYILNGTIEFGKDEIIVISGNTESRFFIHNLSKLEISLYNYENQIELVPGNFLFHDGTTNYVRFSFINDVLTYNFLLKSRFTYLDFKTFIESWTKDKNNVILTARNP